MNKTTAGHDAESGDFSFVEGEWEVHQRYVPSRALVEFFGGLKRKEILGSPVEGTGRIIVPPQDFCELSYRPTGPLVPVGPGGTIRSFTIVHSRFANGPPPPVTMVFVQFDGADTASPGYLQGTSLQPGTELELIGARCRAVFVDAPQGDWRDFWFELETEV